MKLYLKVEFCINECNYCTRDPGESAAKHRHYLNILMLIGILLYQLRMNVHRMLQNGIN